MRRTIACTSMLFTLLIVVLASPLVPAETVVLNYTDRGWYTTIGFHNPSNLNYFVGDNTGFACGTCNRDVRNFFVFELASVTQPIASAKLALYVPNLSPTQQGYISSDPSENFELHDVSTPIANLVNGTGGSAANADLGTGVVYGNRTMTAVDMGNVVEIALNSSAIAALDAATGLIAFGGSLTTLDSMANYELVFGWTHLGTELTQLRLTLVPEPSYIFLLGMAAISLLGYRKARSHRQPSTSQR